MILSGAGLRRLALLLLLPFLLAACGGPAEPVWAPQAAVDAAIYTEPGPPKLTLFTVVNNTNGSGGHSSLMISGSQRVLFDPAGTFELPFAPERNDVHYGMSERALAVYIDYHARKSWDVHIQEMPITSAQAEYLIRAVQAYGAVPKAQCALSIGRILSKTPGFETIRPGYFPNRLEAQFAKFPGVTERIVTDDDADQNHGVLIAATKQVNPEAGFQ